MENIDLSLTLGPLRLKNPVLTASGTFGYGDEFIPFVDLAQLGGIVVKGITLNPRAGNPMPRVCETPGGMLNAIGLANVGVHAFINNKLPLLRQHDILTIVNISGSCLEEYVELAQILSSVPGIAALEINVSCPNVKQGGIQFGIDQKLLAAVVAAVRKATPLPLITKLSPNVTHMAPLAQAAQDAGSDILSLINTVVGMMIDVDREKPALANRIGGLSGPAIRPIALRWVWEVYEKVSLPIIGMGGIESGYDAAAFMLAGASAIAVGTANFYNPHCCMDILKELQQIAFQKNVSCISQLIGRAHE